MISETILSLERRFHSAPPIRLDYESVDGEEAGSVSPEQDALSPDEIYIEPRRVRVPHSLVWSIAILLGLGVLLLAAWGFAQSTWTYGMVPVDSATSVRLTQIRATLAAVGASQAALQQIDIAARPGVNIGDAIEALVSADKALAPLNDDPAIASARQDLRVILSDLQGKRFGAPAMPLVSPTPLPTIDISIP